MKNLLGKFHAESMPVLGLAQYCLAVLGLAQYQWPRQWGGHGPPGPPTNEATKSTGMLSA